MNNADTETDATFPLIGYLPNKEFPSVHFGSFQADRGNLLKADGSHCFLSVTFAQ
jgi:hypothetical protein